VRFAYQTCLRLDRAQDNPLTRVEELPPLRDRGTRILTGFDALSFFGVLPGGQDCSTLAEATRDEHYGVGDAIQAGSQIFAVAYAAQTLDEAARSIAAGHSLVTGGWFDTRSWDMHANSPPLGRQDFHDPEGGSHCVECLGYEMFGPIRLWIVKNSWGTGWGRRGFAFATDAFMLQRRAIYAVEVMRG
jgi:hypothetical protein